MLRFGSYGSSRKNRIVPFGCHAGRGLASSRKAFLTVKKTCNITWGYVAHSGSGQAGRGPGVEFSGPGRGARRMSSHAEKFYKKGAKALCGVGVQIILIGWTETHDHHR